MPRRLTDAHRFVVAAVAGSVGLLALLRLPWIETAVVLPVTRMQGGLALSWFGTPALPVEVTLACSGADALALCVGAILAYPVPWRTRLSAAGGGVALILALNTLRIGTLGRAVASPAWFNALHLYVWPVVLTLAIAAYVFAWMRVADRRRTPVDAAVPTGAAARGVLQPSRRFVVLTVVFVILFFAVSPFYLESAGVLALAGLIARAAAATLGVIGVSAHAAANVLWTPRGGFLVTQECIATPLVPVYLAAICAYSPTWRRLALGGVLLLPLFVLLGIVRLLLVALPEAVASPLFFVHAFYQLLLGAVVVFMAALWRHRTSAALRHGLLGVLVGVLFVYLLGPIYTRVVGAAARGPLDDPQGAIALLPAFQAGLYFALGAAALVAAAWRRFVAGLAALAFTQAAGLLALQAVAGYAGLTPHVRGWAIAGPVLIFAAVVHHAPARR